MELLVILFIIKMIARTKLLNDKVYDKGNEDGGNAIINAKTKAV